MITNPIDQFRHAVSLEKCGKFTEAVDYCQRALDQQPNNADALHLLGVLKFRCKQVDPAIDLIFQAVQRNPRVPDYHNSLGIAVAMKGDRQTAIKAFRKAVRLRPDYAEAWKNLAAALEQQENFAEGLTAIDRAIACRSDDAQAHHRRGLLLGKLGQWRQAAEAHRKALELKLPWEQGIDHLIKSLERSGQFVEAIEWSERAARTTPSPEAYIRLGKIQREAGRVGDAIASHEKAIELDPKLPGAYQNLAIDYWRRSHLDRAIAYYRRAIEVEPSHSAAGSDLLFAMLHDEAVTPEHFFDQSRRWAELFSRHDLNQTFSNRRDPGRRLRIGYVSPDFRRHTILHIIGPVLASHNKEQVEIFCYSNVDRPDGITRYLKSLPDHWRDIRRLTDDQAKRLITDDQIDILVDLAGHWGGNRLGLFALKAAPIQMQIAFPGTTGLSTMDYRVTDAHSDPPGMTEAYHSEQFLRLPCGWPYGPDRHCPEFISLPKLNNGYITFGCLNRPIKISDSAIEQWGRILAAVPESKLMVLTDCSGPDASYLLNRFAVHGIRENRLIPVSRVSRPKYLRRFNQIDIALDTFPYNGETTTCDGLWMGVPLVTLAGNYSQSRRGASHLMNLGLSELIANSPDEYVNIAASLATDLPRLEKLRCGLRDRMFRSRITHGVSYTRALEAGYRQAWQRWCADEPADRPIEISEEQLNIVS